MRPMNGAGWFRHDAPVTAREVDHIGTLIAFGRDREAADIGAAQSKGAQMNVLDQLNQLGAVLPDVVAGITPEQLDNPTPCANFTVAGVLGHMVGGATAFAAAFRGEAPAPIDPPADLLAAFGPALGGLVGAIASDGALTRTVDAPFGAVPGDTFARFVVLDGLVHGWDLATATGQPYVPANELVAAVTEFARDALEPLRDGDTFAAAKPAPKNATPIEQLVALTGRSVPAVAG